MAKQQVIQKANSPKNKSIQETKTRMQNKPVKNKGGEQ